MTNTVVNLEVVNLEAALENSLPISYELWMALDVTFMVNREDLL